AKPPGTDGSSSPAGRTKPPSGIQFSEYTVPFRSNSFTARGGKPMPNSSPRISKRRGAKKWPNSCTNVMGVKMSANAPIIQRTDIDIYPVVDLSILVHIRSIIRLGLNARQQTTHTFYYTLTRIYPLHILFDQN